MRLYLGDTSEEFAERVKSIHPTALLCTNSNVTEVIGNDVLYTSDSDVDHSNLIKLALSADRIDTDINCSQELKEFASLFFSKYPHVILNDLIDQRKTDNQQIWCLGCSYTSSVGVENSERWATQLAKKLNVPVTVLAAPRASIPWAADQILRSDVKKGDQVFWMLTTAHRIDYYSEDDQHIKIWPEIDKKELGSFEYQLMSRVLTHKWLVYLSVKAIKQVQNYCDKLGVNLYIGQAMRNDSQTDSALMSVLMGHKGFVKDFSMQLQFDKFMLDLGTDQQHPGPLTHQRIADIFYNYVF